MLIFILALLRSSRIRRSWILAAAALLNVCMFAQASDFSTHTIWPLIRSADASHVLYLKYDHSKGRLMSCTITPAKDHTSENSVMMVSDRCQDIDGIAFDKGNDVDPHMAARTVQTLLARTLTATPAPADFSVLTDRLKQRLSDRIHP